MKSNLPIGHSYINYTPYLSPVNPSEFTTCALWLDASDYKSIEFVSGSVDKWKDKRNDTYTSTRNLSSVGATRPGYSTNVLNGNPVITFQGDNDTLISDVVQSENFNFSNLAYFLVVRPATTQPTAAAKDLLGIISTDTSGLYGRSLGLNQNTGTWREEYYSGFQNLSAYTGNTWYFVSLEFVGTTSAFFYVNGTASGSPVASATGTNTTGLKIGSYNGDSSYAAFNGNFDVAEVIVFGHSSTTLTSQQRQQLEGYLAWKWGLTANLPSTHPFKNFPPLIVN